jgi:hypothetical protein
MPAQIKPDYTQKIVGAPKLLSDMQTLFHSHVHYNETPAQLEKEIEYRDRSNIYMLCTRSKVRISKGTLQEKMDGTGRRKIAGLLDVFEGKNTRQVAFEVDLGDIFFYLLKQQNMSPHDLQRGTLNIKESDRSSSMVFLELIGIRKDGKRIELTQDLELDGFKKFFKWHVPELQDLKIEYIGKSTGIVHSSNAQKRLEKHEQRVTLMNEAMIQGDKDVIALYLNFDAALSGDFVHQPIDMPRPNIISLVEGALINHFQPRLNTQGLDIFPYSTNLRQLTKELGLEHIEVSVSGDSSSIRLFTDTIPVTSFAVTSHEFDKNGFGHPDRSNSGTIRFANSPENMERQVKYAEANKYEITQKTDALLGKGKMEGGPSIFELLKDRFAARAQSRDDLAKRKALRIGQDNDRGHGMGM